jgi:hypothetical protein
VVVSANTKIRIKDGHSQQINQPQLVPTGHSDTTQINIECHV